ncbi:DUF846-domain-containing protein [Epithele typhae]|uniref:DUF846-domain-containing protein n=1 Tax=Epithele typhae TaxID=378194 RepID=UPI0020080C42|nr:DUF846-domain-containing protein [Epithele typhae]KAH9944444.1 DUF846-domain-containing protein [Epithele typhae]
MSSNTPLFDTIEPDEPEYERRTSATGNIASGPAPAATNTRTAPTQLASTPGDAESGAQARTCRPASVSRSAHPTVLFFLYAFRSAALAVYILCGFFISSYVLSSVIVVVLLAMDFWNCKNVAGRRLVGLRYWNQVDDDGESYWVFESRDVAVYTFPVAWVALLIVALISNLSFVPLVILALVFNVTNAIGFTYADRDAKQKWANNLAASSWGVPGLGGLGGQLLTGVVKTSVGRVFSGGR